MTDQQDLMALAQRWQDEAAASWGETKEHSTLQRCCDELREAASQLRRADEPVRYVRWHPKHGYRWDDTHETPFPDYARSGWSSVPLYTHPQLPAGAPEYDRELIAEMLTDERSMPVSSYSREAINEQVSLLRAADNRDAEGVHTARREVSVPSREACFDLWMATDEDHSSLGEHIHRFAKSLPAAAPQPDSQKSGEGEVAGVHTAKREDGVPDGWMLVPMKPTQIMLQEGWERLPVERLPNDIPLMDFVHYIYEAMLAAAPQPDNKESR